MLHNARRAVKAKVSEFELFSQLAGIFLTMTNSGLKLLNFLNFALRSRGGALVLIGVAGRHLTCISQ
jgi:hypothetical protein